MCVRQHGSFDYIWRRKWHELQECVFQNGVAKVYTILLLTNYIWQIVNLILPYFRFQSPEQKSCVKPLSYTTVGFVPPFITVFWMKTVFVFIFFDKIDWEPPLIRPLQKAENVLEIAESHIGLADISCQLHVENRSLRLSQLTWLNRKTKTQFSIHIIQTFDFSSTPTFRF